MRKHITFRIGQRNLGVSLLFVASFAVLGTVLLLSSHAASPTANLEAENGTLSSSVVGKVIDTTASGSQSVKFGSSSSNNGSAVLCSGRDASGGVPAGTWPGAACTGVLPGTTFTPSGDITVTANNTVIQNMDITGSVTVKATGVKIINCKIHDGGYYGVQVASGGATVTNSEFYGFTVAALSITGTGSLTVQQVNIHNTGGDGLKLTDNTTLQDSYLHDFTPAAGDHADGSQMQGGSSNIVVNHNTITPNTVPGSGGGTNSALLFEPYFGSGTGPITISNNLLGYGNYSLYIVVVPSLPANHQLGYSVTNNRFLRGTTQYGPVDVSEPATSITTWSGNIWDDTGAAIGQ